MRMLFFAIFFSVHSHAITLLQEEKDIVCENSQIRVIIDKRDQFIEVYENNQVRRYSSVEFLDSGILLKSSDEDSYSTIQFTVRGQAVLIEGRKQSFQESDCRDQGAAKYCQLKNLQFFWSSERLALKKERSQVEYDVESYGIHPNDGTYFLGLNSSREGLAVLDSGVDVTLVYGKAEHLLCRLAQ